MPTVESPSVANQPSIGAQTVWQTIRAQLESARQRIIGEISNYPAPRPACDADFNHLLEERARISDELNRLHAAANSAPANFREQIEDFIAKSNYLDDAGRQKIRSLILKLPR